MAGGFIGNPVLNSPYRVPARHFELGDDGTSIGTVLDGRRRSEYLVPAPPSRKRGRQIEFEPEPVEGENDQRTTANPFINELRGHVERWRALRGGPPVPLGRL